MDFLRAHPPFDALEVADVERVAACAEVEFFLAGTIIFAKSAQPVEHLRVVRTGAVEIVLDEVVLDELGPGELFGHASMLSGLPPGFEARAQEDALCYRIPEETARAVLARPESVALRRALAAGGTRTRHGGAGSTPAGHRPCEPAGGGADSRPATGVLA